MIRRTQTRHRFLAPILALLLTLTAAAPALAQEAVALLYHRFGDSRTPSTNIRLEQFEGHLAELTSEPYRVLPLHEIVEALESGTALPDFALAITIDDGFRSVYTQAWPRLKAAGLPFTLFITSDVHDQGLPDYMSWEELREMAADPLVTIAAHTKTHAHLVGLLKAEVEAEIDRSMARYEAELGLVPDLFAYPYGEYGLATREVVVAAGYRAAFGQQSGPLGPSSDRFALPRYPLNEAYGDLDRLRLVIRSRHLPTADVTPADPVVDRAGNPPLYGFTVTDESLDLGAMTCFAGGARSRLERLGSSRVEVRLDAPFTVGRNRINCTLPAGKGRWYWYGRQFYVPRGAG